MVGNAIGGLGLVTSQGQGVPPVGVEYVLATPSGRAVLRPLRYPFYDTEEFENAQTATRTLFTDHRQFAASNSLKTECDLNRVAAVSNHGAWRWN